MVQVQSTPPPSPNKTFPKVVIIGAGIGGVTLAARLAHLGYPVTVIEKNSFSGGRCSIIEKNGFRFDQGPRYSISYSHLG
jgi:phytoene desaturase (3,4-didehydrolycopene-forming)